MRLIDADALKDAYIKCPDHISFFDFGEIVELFLQAIDKQPTIAAPRWVRCEDELPDDGEWAIFTNGKVVTVERFKLDAYNHFFPASQWFDFEDAIAWMPLPEPPQEVQE